MTTAAQSDSIKSGIDLSHRDPATRPQDDLFVHVNGRWLTDHEIPADRAVDGAFRALYDRAEVDVRAIIEAAASADAEAGSITRKIGDLYASFMDTAAVAAAGLAPLEEELTQVRAAADRDALADLLGRLQRVGVGGLVGNFVDTDAKDSERYLVHLNQSGLGLPDESYYREDTYAPIREKYVDHVAAMFALAGFADSGSGDAAGLAQRVFDLETALAGAHWDVVRNRDADLTYNLHTLADLDNLAPGFPWRTWALAIGGTEQSCAEVVVRQPGFLTGAAQLWEQYSLDDWKTWLSWRVIRSRAPYLTDDLVQQNFEFYGKTLTGTEELRERWKRGVSLVEDLLGEAVGKLYVERHFPESSKDRMEELVANLIEAYRRNIAVLEWMSPATREAALRKLEKFTPKIGYPAKWRDYSSVQVSRGDLVANFRSGYAAEHDRDLAKLGGPVDRDEWFMTPQTVNAYYNPGMNEIVFPAAILQPPFFDPDADDAANYGGIGAVIGHEIGHGFDDQGAKYDGDGNMVDWWTDDDRAEFGKRTKALIAQYGEFEPQGLPGHKVNGELTIGENIGDLGGLSIALAAYKIAVAAHCGSDAPSADEQPPVIDELTGIQRVFFGWAQVWRTKTRESEAIRRLAIDPHSPPEFRCNGVIRNVDEFHTAFGVTEGDELYLDPAERVRIW